MQVPTTHTFSSRHKEGKDLADQNAQKLQERDVLDREIKERINFRDELIRKSGYTPAEYIKVEKEHLEKIESMEDRAVKARIELMRLESQLSEKRTALATMTQQEEKLSKKIPTLEEDIRILTERRENIEKAAIESRNKFDNLITEKSKELTFLTDETNKIKNANIATSNDLKKRMDSVVEQERTMSIRRTDLEIYEARLRNKYPNEKFI